MDFMQFLEEVCVWCLVGQNFLSHMVSGWLPGCCNAVAMGFCVVATGLSQQSF